MLVPLNAAAGSSGDGNGDPVALAWSYDAAGNIRSLTQSYRPMDPAGLSATTTTAQTAWYAYDSMDRVVVSQGALVGGDIVRGWGVTLTYDAAGQRRTATTASGVAAPGNAAPGGTGLDGIGPDGIGGAHREIYTYGDDGQLIAVDQADAGADGVFAAPQMLARYTRDALGRTMLEDDYDAGGGVARSRHAIVYDNRNQVLSETDTQRQGSDVFTSNTSNFYGASGVLQSSATQTWKAGGGTTSNDTTTYAYTWRDGPLTRQVTLTNTDGTTQSLYGYDNAGRLTQVQLTGGQRPRTVVLTTDLSGQILTRDEVSAASLNPHSRNYVFDGVQMGTVGNDGTDNMTFAAAIAEGSLAPPASDPGAFRAGATFGSAYANFDRQHDAVNPTNAQSAATSYTVRSGDTLASIAQATWGDANLWYLIAGANGLSGAEELVAGRTLSMPNRIVNRANTSDTFRPYDPNEALGDVQPNTPTPRPQGKKKNKCGIFGAILLAVVAIAVVVVSQGALTGVAGAILGTAGTVTTGSTILGGALAAAAGSVVSQGVGLATGIQDRFDFKSVALAAISSGVAGGTAVAFGSGAVGGSRVLGNLLRGAVGSVVTQGVAVATGLQNQFNWAAVAVGGAVGGVAGSIRAPGVGGRLVSSLAGSVAGAATRSLIDGSDFGDNIIATLPDVIASTVGAAVVDRLANGRSAKSATSAQRDAVVEEPNTPSGRRYGATGGAMAMLASVMGQMPLLASAKGSGADTKSDTRTSDPAGAADDPVPAMIEPDIVVIGRPMSLLDTIAYDLRLHQIAAAIFNPRPERATITTNASPTPRPYVANAQAKIAAFETNPFNRSALVQLAKARAAATARGDAAVAQADREFGALLFGPPALAGGLVTGAIGFGLIAQGSYAAGGTTLVLGANDALGGARDLLTLGNGRTPLAELGNSLTGTGQTGMGVGDYVVIGANVVLGGVGVATLRAGRGPAVVAAERTAVGGAADLPSGSFSISDWSGYPAGVPRPQGPFRIVEGAEYNAARDAANNANRAIRREQGLVGQPVDVHEIQPVKFGGSPTDPANKVVLPRDVHRQQVTPWWNQFQRDIGH